MFECAHAVMKMDWSRFIYGTLELASLIVLLTGFFFRKSFNF